MDTDTTAASGNESCGTGCWQKTLCICRWKTAFADKWLAPLADLGLRLAIANVFWKSGKTKIIENCETGLVCVSDNARNLFEWEYIPAWEKNAPFPPPLSAGTMAELATWTELAMPVLLLIGLGTRPAAFVLLGMAVVIELFIYPGNGEHYLWMAILAAIVIRGGGVLSLDHLVRLQVLDKKSS